MYEVYVGLRSEATRRGGGGPLFGRFGRTMCDVRMYVACVRMRKEFPYTQVSD